MSRQFDLTPQSPSRTFVTGTSGSGKTELSLAMAVLAPKPLIIIDTKYDPSIKDFSKRHGIPIIYDLPDWRGIKNDVIVRPPPECIANPKLIDEWLADAFECKFVPTILIDEGYQVGATNRALGVGVSGLWTRGRAFGMRTIFCAQRPAWISKFILTESDTYFIGYLKDDGDRKALATSLGEPALRETLGPRKFHYIKNGQQALKLAPLKLEQFRALDRRTMRGIAPKRMNRD